MPNIFRAPRAPPRRAAGLPGLPRRPDGLRRRPVGEGRARAGRGGSDKSGVNDCPYCVVAHGAILRIRSAKDAAARRLRGRQPPWGCDLAPLGSGRSSTLRWHSARTPASIGETEPAGRPRRGADRGRTLGRRRRSPRCSRPSNRLAHLFALRPNRRWTASPSTTSAARWCPPAPTCSAWSSTSPGSSSATSARRRPAVAVPLPWVDDDPGRADMWATADESRERDRRAVPAGMRRTRDATIEALAARRRRAVPWWPPERREVTLHRVLVQVVAETHSTPATPTSSAS